jgi:hypothetical protein
MRGGFGRNVIVSMGKLVDSSKNQNFLDILKLDQEVFLSAVSNDSEKIDKALKAYTSLEFAGEYVISCGYMSELNEALDYGKILNIFTPNAIKVQDGAFLTKYLEAVKTLSEMIGANMRTESRHDTLVEEYTSKGKKEPNKSKLSPDVLNSPDLLSDLQKKGIFIEDEWFPDKGDDDATKIEKNKEKRGRKGRPAYQMKMTNSQNPYFLPSDDEGTNKAPALGEYLNGLNKRLMSCINNHSIKGGKSLFADLEVPFALLVDSKEEIDKSRVMQGEWLEELETNLSMAKNTMEELDSVFKEAMNKTFVLTGDKIYNEIFVQTDVYSNPKEMDDLLAILCLSRMCTKLTLSFDTVAIGDNFRIMHADFLSKEGWMGHAKVVLK